MIKKIKHMLRFLANTPLHPQWFIQNRQALIKWLQQIKPEAKVVDIGCFNKWAKQHLASDIDYIGLDYPGTATEWYQSIPDVYGDAHDLPFSDESLDTILYFDVLEHIHNIDVVLLEAHRTLKAGGEVLGQIPFLYPLHDEPFDYRRLTEYGIKSLAERLGFTVIQSKYMGQPLETAALLTNIALTKTTLNWLTSKNPLVILGVILFPVLILITNLSAALLSTLSANDGIMPFSYQFILKKH